MKRVALSLIPLLLIACEDRIPEVLSAIQIEGGTRAVLHHPRPIVIAWDDSAADGRLVERTLRTAMASPTYWSGLAQYEVGEGGTTSLLILHEPPAGPLELNESIGELLTDLVVRGLLPEPDADTVYMFVPPKDAPFITSRCSETLGYHAETSLRGRPTPYAMILRCDDDAGSPAITATHELVEAATDPFPWSSPAYIDYAFGEIVDLCQGSWGEIAPLAVEGSVEHVARYWSNRDAALGRGACLPAGADAPSLADLRIKVLSVGPLDVDLDPSGDFTFSPFVRPVGSPGRAQLELSLAAPAHSVVYLTTMSAFFPATTRFFDDARAPAHFLLGWPAQDQGPTVKQLDMAWAGADVIQLNVIADDGDVATLLLRVGEWDPYDAPEPIR